ncbi:ribbon-helix-helix protein, CopG family [Leptolyngbya sp. PL-A3]|uniref:ribbon-helix-helix domain-containing protein n=1 Tax=Leptolyngbya sp. PL-A3 TaxID=2933911 RepID=UPI00329A4B76
MIAASTGDFPGTMPTQKATVYFTCQPELKEALQKWAEEEGRSLSNLMERIAIAALADKTKGS